MKQEIIQRALDKIQERKRKNIAEFQSKMQPLYDDEKYMACTKKHTQIMIENAKKEALGFSPDKQAEEKFLTEQKSIMKQYGLENVQMEYSCPICKDEGYKNGQICKCLKKEISNILMKDSGFENLENFADATKTSNNLSPYYKKMQEWCHTDFKKNLLLLSGQTGVGKTYLTRCMANELIERGLIVKMSTAFKMTQDFKSFHKSHNEELLNQYLDCQVLFIDDLGTEPLYKDITLEYLYLIINERKMRKLPTVITTNLDISQIRETYDERIYSRIVDRQTSITIFLDGTDRRINK